LYYIAQAVAFGNIAGDGYFTRQCSELLEKCFGIGKVLYESQSEAARSANRKLA
jgi:hypothetical protein